MVFKRLINLEFHQEGFPFVILNHVLDIVDVWQPRFDIASAGDSVVFLQLLLLLLDEFLRLCSELREYH